MGTATAFAANAKAAAGKTEAVPYNQSARSGPAISPEALAQLRITRAVAPPTAGAPTPFESNWSGTRNYTYTAYWFGEGQFRV